LNRRGDSETYNVSEERTAELGTRRKENEKEGNQQEQEKTEEICEGA
jgi:hypothetical protein